MVKIGTVWDRTTEFLGGNLPAVMPIALLAIFVPVSIQGNLAPLMVPGDLGRILIVQLISIVLILIALWGQLAILALAIDPAIGTSGATALATRRFLPAIGVAIVVGIAAGLLTVPMFVALKMAGVDFSAMRSGTPTGVDAASISAGLGWFIGLYLLAMIVVFLWAAARLLLVNPVIVAERRGLGTIARSFSLTKGLALKIVGVLILFVVVYMVASLAAKTVFGSILNLVAGGDGAFTLAGVLTAIIVGAITTAFYIIVSAFTAKLYVAARDARDSIAEPL